MRYQYLESGEYETDVVAAFCSFCMEGDNSCEECSPTGCPAARFGIRAYAEANTAEAAMRMGLRLIPDSEEEAAQIRELSARLEAELGYE